MHNKDINLIGEVTEQQDLRTATLFSATVCNKEQFSTGDVMYQHILIPVDSSPTSDRALQEALKLAKQQNAQLELVYVVENTYLLSEEIYINYGELLETMRNGGEKILEHAQMLVQQAGMTAETKLLESGGERVASIIVAEARRWSADLIVIGTHGRSGFSRLLLGSVAEGIVRTAHIPVLLIRST